MTSRQSFTQSDAPRAKSKIIQVLPCYPPHLGGVEQRVRDLSERLANRGHDVRVVTSDNGTYTHNEIKGNPKVFYLKSWFFANTSIIPSLIYVLAKQPKDAIVHIHISQALTPEIAFLVAKVRGQPVVIHIRGDVGPSSGIGKVLLPIYKKVFLKNILLRADKIIVLTQDYSKMINERYGVSENKIVVIPNATSLAVRRTVNTKITGEVKLLLVGRLSIQKNIELAIEGLAELINTGVKARLVLVGDGDLRNKLLSLAKELEVDSHVKFLGRLEGKALEDAYRKSDIVVQTSFDEGLSTVLLEAMSSGKPIIAGNILGTRSVIKDGYNGLLIDPHSVESLVEAIRKLINRQELRDKLVRNGLKEIKKYRWDEVVKSTEEVYEEASHKI